MTETNPTTLWKIREKDASFVECRMTFVPNGVEIQLVSRDSHIFSRIFPTGYEALEWAKQERADREGLVTAALYIWKGSAAGGPARSEADSSGVLIRVKVSLAPLGASRP
jgi:hypothetical protein